MSKLFTERIPFKPFEYPIYYNEGWLKQDTQANPYRDTRWQMDVKDWNENLTDSEKNLVGNILLGLGHKLNVWYPIIGQTWLLIGFRNMKSDKWL